MTQTTTVSPALGLRERKLRQARARVERVAVELVASRGYDDVSVELICERAEISPRTFYNYFGSKDAAILGPLPSSVPDETVEAFVRGETPVPSGQTRSDILDGLLWVYTQSGQNPLHDSKLRKERLHILQQHPALLVEHVSRVERLQSQANQAIARRIASETGEPADSPELAGRARLYLTMAASVLHAAMHRRLTSDTSSDGLLERLREARVEAADLLAGVRA